MISIREQDATIPADASRPPKPLITPTSDSTGPRCTFCADRSQNTAQAGQRGGRGEDGQAAGPAISILRLPIGTPNLSWIDPSQKGYGVQKSTGSMVGTKSMRRREKKGCRINPGPRSLT